MSEQRTDNDPTSLRDEVDEIYSGQGIIEYLRAARSIGQEATRRSLRMRTVTNVHVPELFGRRGEGSKTKPPVSPDR